MPSAATSIHGIAAALRKAAEYGRFPDRWLPGSSNTDAQASFLNILPGFADADRIREIETVATPDYRELIQWFQQRGWNMPISPYSAPEFGVGAILDVLSLWSKPGERRPVQWDGQSYMAVHMGNDHHFQFHRAAPEFRRRVSGRGTAEENLVVAFATQNPGETIFLMMHPAPVGRIFDLFNAVRAAREKMDRSAPIPTPHGRWVNFPMVNLAVDTDISWLEQMRSAEACPLFGTLPAIIKQALQKNRLRINDLGARAESATALVMVGAAASRTVPLGVEIDQPFLFWIERANVQQPIFMAYVDRDTWSDPGDIRAQAYS